jgi:hypothetical protein
MLKGRPASLEDVLAAARRLIAQARKPVALISSWGSNEELAVFKSTLGSAFTCLVKEDMRPVEGERIEDDLLIRADKNPNTARARELFGEAAASLPADADLVLVWGEGFDFNDAPHAGAAVIFLNAFLQPENGFADVFLPVSLQTERAGSYTNCNGGVSTFQPCFEKPPGVVDAASVFAAMARGGGVMIQDLLVYGVYIAYAVALLLAFGTLLTWVERKQAAVMADRIGANRAYIRLPFTRIKLIWIGLFHGLADGMKMLLKEDFKPRTYDWFAYASPRGWCSPPFCWCSRRALRRPN